MDLKNIKYIKYIEEQKNPLEQFSYGEFKYYQKSIKGLIEFGKKIRKDEKIRHEIPVLINNFGGVDFQIKVIFFSKKYFKNKVKINCFYEFGKTRKKFASLIVKSENVEIESTARANKYFRNNICHWASIHDIEDLVKSIFVYALKG